MADGVELDPYRAAMAAARMEDAAASYRDLAAAFLREFGGAGVPSGASGSDEVVVAFRQAIAEPTDVTATHGADMAESIQGYGRSMAQALAMFMYQDVVNASIIEAASDDT